MKENPQISLAGLQGVCFKNKKNLNIPEDFGMTELDQIVSDAYQEYQEIGSMNLAEIKIALEEKIAELNRTEPSNWAYLTLLLQFYSLYCRFNLYHALHGATPISAIDALPAGLHVLSKKFRIFNLLSLFSMKYSAECTDFLSSYLPSFMAEKVIPYGTYALLATHCALQAPGIVETINTHFPNFTTAFSLASQDYLQALNPNFEEEETSLTVTRSVNRQKSS